MNCITTAILDHYTKRYLRKATIVTRFITSVTQIYNQSLHGIFYDIKLLGIYKPFI